MKGAAAWAQAYRRNLLRLNPEKEHAGKKLRVAIVGCGGISDLHLKTYKKYPDVEIVAGVDIKPEAAWTGCATHTALPRHSATGRRC